MMNSLKIKESLYQQCVDFANNRLQTIQEIIASNQKALVSETKSSAGDKHETGRAMLQLEMEKASQQLTGINEMKLVLSKIKFDDASKFIKLGSLIITNQTNYFLAISAGQLIISGNNYYAVSPSSPIGKMLLGKKVDDDFIFNGKKISINRTT